MATETTTNKQTIALDAVVAAFFRFKLMSMEILNDIAAHKFSSSV